MAKDGGFPLPAVIDPPLVCLKLYVPNDPDHLRAFWGCLQDLTRWRNWQRDDQKRGKDVAAVWRRVWLQNWNINQNLDACGEQYVLPQFRFVGCNLEYSYDGGLWVPVSGWDTFAAGCFRGPQGPQGPQGLPGPQGPQGPKGDPGEPCANCPPPTPDPPGAPSPSKRCAVAVGLTDWIREWYEYTLDQWDLLASVVGVAVEVLAALKASLVVAAVVQVVELVQEFGSSAIRSQNTPAFWETVRCKLYCALDDNAAITNNTLAAWRDGIAFLNDFGWRVVDAQIAAMTLEEARRRAFVYALEPTSECELCDCGDQECQPIVPTKSAYAYGVDQFCVWLGKVEGDYIKAVVGEHGNVSVGIIFTSDVNFSSVTMKTRYTGGDAYVRYGFRIYDANDDIVYTRTFWGAITGAYDWYTDALSGMNITGRRIVFYAQDMTQNGAWQYFSMKDMQFTLGGW